MLYLKNKISKIALIGLLFVSVQLNATSKSSLLPCGPALLFGDVRQGATPLLEDVAEINAVEVRCMESPGAAPFEILGGVVQVEGANDRGHILPNGDLDETAKKLLRQSGGKQVVLLASYNDSDGSVKQVSLVFTVSATDLKD